MTGTDTLAGLLRGCLADFDEDAPRLVLADHLRELGDDDRADFIGIQCAIDVLSRGQFLILPESPRGAKIDALRGRERDLLARHLVAWTPTFLLAEYGPHRAGRGVEYRRGFPAGLRGKQPIGARQSFFRWTATHSPQDVRRWSLSPAVYRELLPDPKCIGSEDGEFDFRDYATEADAVRGLALAMMRLTVSHLLGEQS